MLILIFYKVFLYFFYSKPLEGLQLTYEKSTEDFYAICDQLEINLVNHDIVLTYKLPFMCET